MRDFTPDEIEEHPGTGGGDRFADFLDQELLPFVESTYRTQPYRLLFGHSYGGSLAFYMLVTRSHLFGGCIAASPNLLIIQPIEERVKKMLEAPGISRKSLYISAGETEGDLGNKISSVLATVKDLSDRDLDWQFEILANEGHSSTPHQTVYNALEHIFREYSSFGESIDGAGLERRFSDLSERLGYEVEPPLSTLVNLGNSALANNRLDQAESIFGLIATLYPDSVWGHVSLGSVYFTKGDLATAETHFREALRIDPDNRYSQDMLREIVGERETGPN
jgi:hypothetical protein